MIFLFICADDLGDQTVADDVGGAEGDRTDAADPAESVKRVRSWLFLIDLGIKRVAQAGNDPARQVNLA